MNTEWSKISLTFFFLVALIGTLLRSVAFIPIPLDYVNLIHAHSHTAFQGWVYLIMHLLLTKTFLTQKQITEGYYPLQFKLTVFIVIGVFISFSLQGYGLYSIICSTLFQILNYWFIFRFFKDLKKENEANQSPIAIKFIKTGIWFGLISTVLPYIIGISSAKGLNGTDTYNSLVYSFLHLQYNGWFLFVALGLFYNYLDTHHIKYNKKHGTRFYWLFTIAAVPAISLSLLGMGFANAVLPIAYLSAVLIGSGLVFFVATIYKNLWPHLRQESIWFTFYFLSFLASFVLKTILQCISVFPFFKSFAFYNKPIILAYLHLSLIGSISFLFLSLIIKKGWLVINGRVKMGSALLLLGFVASELLLTTTGFGLFHHQIILIIASAAMCLGIFLLVISGKQKHTMNGTT